MNFAFSRLNMPKFGKKWYYFVTPISSGKKTIYGVKNFGITIYSNTYNNNNNNNNNKVPQETEVKKRGVYVLQSNTQ